MLKSCVVLSGVSVILLTTIYPLVLVALMDSYCFPELFGVPCSVHCYKSGVYAPWSIQICEDDNCCNLLGVNQLCDYPGNVTEIHVNTTCVQSIESYGCKLPYYVGLKCNYGALDIAFFLLFLLAVVSAMTILVIFPLLLYDNCIYIYPKCIEMCGSAKYTIKKQLRRIQRHNMVDLEDLETSSN